jgi:hypothetical protein
VLRLTVLDQALIQHDLRAEPWPDPGLLAEIFGRADACFSDLVFRPIHKIHKPDPGVLASVAACVAS